MCDNGNANNLLTKLPEEHQPAEYLVSEAHPRDIL